MAQAFGIKVTGLTEAIKRTKGVSKQVEAEVDGFFEDAANEFTGRAMNAAPADRGFLRSPKSISPVKYGKLRWAVVCNSDYAAYMEFGTGVYVQVPSGLESYAAQFKGAGQGGGGDVKQLIYDWCKRKGIDKGAWWIIYITIMTKGVRPHPFFFIQGPVVLQSLKRDIESIKL